MCDHSIYILYSRSSKYLQRTLRESSIRPVVNFSVRSRWVSNDISSILNFKLQSINLFSRMITHFVSSRLYKGTVESKIPGGGWRLFTSRISLIRDILWFRLPLDIAGLFKMVFDCLWVVVDVFGWTLQTLESLFSRSWTKRIFFLSSHLEIERERSQPCQSLEIWQVVQEDNQPPEPEEPEERRKTTRARGTTRTTRTRRTREPRKLGTRRRVCDKVE